MAILVFLGCVISNYGWAAMLGTENYQMAFRLSFSQGSAIFAYWLASLFEEASSMKRDGV